MSIVKRYWSLLVALFIPLVQSYADRIPDPIEHQDPSNAVMALCFIYGAGVAICLCLLLHSWMMQRRCARNKWRLVFWTHALLLPALVTIGLGFHRLQTYTYELAVDFQHWGGGRWYQDLHFYADGVEDRLFWFVLLDFVLVVFWAIVAALKNKTSRPVSGPA
jgi:hypothetical protein